MCGKCGGFIEALIPFIGVTAVLFLVEIRVKLKKTAKKLIFWKKEK